ncbi:efflux RND transporter permease subunit [Dethiothermospora halolimnae]|uniref:efflux RND transporter permease subunit n=1 Tax=Dethiothermospora halolimnae TaxID=3114390 RepID=UPI003CCB79CC
MNLSKLAVNRPVTIIMITLIILLLGFISLTRLPIDLLPEIEVPVAIVQTTYRGVGPEEIEKLITKPLEETIVTVDNIKNVSSVSSEGSSIVIAEFNFGTDMDFASLKMRENVDLVKGYLPDGANDPMVMKIDPNAQPIMNIAISNGGDLAKLQNIAEDTIKPRLERLEGVASIDIIGGYEREIEVSLNQRKMMGYGISIDYISKIIGAENLNLPGGRVTKGSQDLIVRTMGEFKSIDEIKRLPIPLKTGGVVYLEDLAEVKFKNKELDAISKLNGNKSIGISIQKQSGSNTVTVANRVNEEIKNLEEDLNGINIKVVLDLSEFIKLSINNVMQNAIIGAILAIVILYLFLRNFRTTIIIGTAIPISIIATFILIYFNDITLNLMTLGGLALGIGMLVDNAIVVLENIYRFRQDGYSRKEAAIKGAKEVGIAVTASTLTTIAVFLPIVFIEGIASTIFKELALTVTMSLIASLLVSLTIIPMLSSKFLKVDREQGEKHNNKFRLFSIIYDTFDKLFFKVESIYKRILKWAITHRKTTVLLAILIFVVSMVSIFSVGAEFFPKVDEGQITISVSLPQGAELEETNNIVTKIENKIKNVAEIESVLSNIGSSGAISFGGNNSNKASITVSLIDLDKRDRSTSEIADELRSRIKDIPGADKKVSEASSMMMGGAGGAPISIDIKGDDIDTLKTISEDFKDIITSIDGTRGVETTLSDGIPEVRIKINRQMASQYGLTAAQIANSVKSTISGTTATRYKIDGDEIDIVVKGDEIFSKSISNLGQSFIDTPMDIRVPLAQVSDISIERGPVGINRDGQVRTVSVTSQILGRDLKSITDDIRLKIDEYNMPEGYSYEFGGENKELNDAFSDLGLALILAVVLVYMILASQFESLLHPFSIMLSVPLAFAGGALALFLTRRSLSVPALIGFIMLAGIVVNNAIVLIDYINTRRREGENRTEAIINSGPIRLRPILMTTLTTVLGLIPLALGIGEGAETQAPMATAVIGGLLLSTVLTLVFIPVVYTLFDDLARFIKVKIFKRKSA